MLGLFLLLLLLLLLLLVLVLLILLLLMLPLSPLLLVLLPVLLLLVLLVLVLLLLLLLLLVLLLVLLLLMLSLLTLVRLLCRSAPCLACSETVPESMLSPRRCPLAPLPLFQQARAVHQGCGPGWITGGPGRHARPSPLESGRGVAVTTSQH